MTNNFRQKIAYLVNRYPKVSHSFIRREINGLEDCGLTITRFSLRNCEEELVDSADRAELERTRAVLAGGISGLWRGMWQTVVANPWRLLQALALATKIGWRSDRGIWRHLAYLAEACVLRGWLVEENITHLHAHFGTNSAAVALLCRCLGGPPYSFTIHGPEEFDKASLLALDRKTAGAAFVAVVSSFGRSQLMRWTASEHWSRIKVIHCGLDAEFLNQPPTTLPDIPRLVCVGRLCEQKGQLLLVEAVAQLVAAQVPVELVLVGDGPLRAEIEAIIARDNLQDHITITGWASGAEVRRQLQHARALVLPSFAEGLPVVIMEAMALGRPVISTYVAGIPELVEPGSNGWLVPAGSVIDLVQAMREALEASCEHLSTLGGMGASRVADRHNAVTEAKKLQELFAVSSKVDHEIQDIADSGVGST